MRFIFCILLTLCFSLSLFSQALPKIIKIKNKFGLIDRNGEVVLPIENDTIYSSIPDFEQNDVKRISPVFIYKRNKKYGFAYQVGLDTLYSFKLLSKDKSYWKVEDAIYDSIVKIHFDVDFYTDTTSGFDRRPYYVFKYKLNNKWGLFYIRGVGTSVKNGYWSLSGVPGYLGRLETTKPIFDEIGEMIGYSLYEGKLNGKWTFLQVLYKPANYGANEKWNKDHSAFKWEFVPLIWGDRTFNDSFDTIVPLGGRNYDERKYFNVKKGDKWGTIKLDNKGMLNQFVPCIYNSIAREQRPIIAYTDTSTVLYDYDGKAVEVQLVKDKDYSKFVTSLEFKQYYIYYFYSHQNFLNCANYGTGELTPSHSYNIVVIDSVTYQAVEIYKSSENVMYDRLKGDDRTSYLIRKVVQVEKGYIDYFIDLETKEVMFTLSRENEEDLGECYSIREGEPQKNNLSIFKYTKRKSGDMKKKAIGCYDFITKTYKQGKCR